MKREKTLFLSSKHTPIALYEHIFKWVDGLTDISCIACFNSTELESEVLKALLVARIPTILFVMNRFTDVNNIQIERAIRENRLLIVILKRDEPVRSGSTPMLRNKYVLSLCQHIVCGYVSQIGIISLLLKGKNDVERIIPDKVDMLVTEPAYFHERWTVSQDKVLLRMYYEDMGIHAIHKKLHRSYIAVYMRIRSITQPEDALKGREFEDYVLSLFKIQPDGPLILEEGQGDKSLGNVRPQNNSNPDLVFRYGEQKFAVECKWRERLESKDIGKKTFPHRVIEKYLTFSSQRNIPVTIVLGVAGEPCNPEFLYVIPIEKIGAIVSASQNISDFIVRQNKFDISLFINN